MKRHSLLESLKRLIPELPRTLPAGSGAPLQFSSSGGGGNLDDPDDDYYDDLPDEQPQASRRDRREDPQATAARRRTVQSEPDDRYWTDYLRIALPVIGLLLVIAVFWYWAQQLIDDDNGGNVTGTEPAGVAEVVETETVEPTVASTPEEADTGDEQEGQQVAPPTTTQDNDPQEQTQPSPTPSPEPEQPSDNELTDEELSEALQGVTGGGGGEADGPSGAIQADMAAVVTEDGGGLSLRSEATNASGDTNVITNLDAGTELTVVSGPIEADGFTWWEVVVTATGDRGFVVEEFIEPAE